MKYRYPFAPLKRIDIVVTIEQAKRDSLDFDNVYRVYRWVTSAVQTDGLPTEMCGYSDVRWSIGAKCEQLGTISNGEFHPSTHIKELDTE